MLGSGFEGCFGGDGRLQPFGVLFADLTAAHVAASMAVIFP
jgi:hypothetical protein